MLRTLLFACSCLLLTTSLFSQRNCGAMDHLEQLMQDNPGLEQEMNELERFTNQYVIDNAGKAFSGGVLTIPVIVHVVYNGNQENISDNQIQSQIDVLNEDFRRTNSDASNTPNDFVGVAADSDIEFCLSQTIRVSTTVGSFGTNDAVKFASSGGSNVVTPNAALNLWVCDIGGGILGYAQFPGGPASSDGVVCDYRYFGTTGTATAPFDLGRTATHEVGHWLNLRHIWGDGGCRVDDQVSDTPPAGGPNYTGSPCTYPGPNSCRPRGNQGGTDFPDMFQNYMDYSDDGCMNLFTEGQKTRMWAAINGARSGLLAAPCDGTPPPAVEICNNGQDDDGDGQIDCADGDCAGDAACAPPGSCDAPTGLSHRRRRGGREATLSWNATSGASTYDVEVYNGSGGLFASGTISGTAADVTGLTKNAPYTWRVRANCGSDVSIWADGSFNARLAGVGIDAEVTVYPNPTSENQVILSWDLGLSSNTIAISEIQTSARENGAVSIVLRDLTGRLLAEQKQLAGDSQTTLDISTLKRGIYLIQLTAEDGYSVSTRLVKL